MNALIVICTRPESRRLPGKCFKRIAGVPAIEHILRRIEPTNIPVVLAIPDTEKIKGIESPYDDLIYKLLCNGVFRGDPDSPLTRTLEAVQFYEKHKPGKISHVIRITHDDLLIDAETMVRLLTECQTVGADYGISPSIVNGAGVEVISRANLEHAVSKAEFPVEHISYAVKNFGVKVEICPRPSIIRNYRLTLDYPEDALVLETVLRHVGPFALLDEVCAFIDTHPSVMRVNQIPDISFYTCAYNAEKWITRTIDSVSNHHQFGRAEYIIVDDCSTDKTLTRVMTHRTNKFNLLVNEENIGLSSSCNRAVEAARGRYVMRVDADDTLVPGASQAMMNRMVETGAAIVYAGYNEIDENDRPLRVRCDPREHHHLGCALMDKRVIDEVRFTDGLRHWDSLDVFSRISNKFEIAYIDAPLWNYRRHADSMSAKPTPERIAARAALE